MPDESGTPSAAPGKGESGPGMAGAGAPPAPPAGSDQPVESGLWQSLAWGFASAWACRRVMLFILVANLVLAAAVVFPLLGPMDGSLSHHPEAERIGREMDVRWWEDWTTRASGAVGQVQTTMSLAGFVMVLAGTFFAGGLLEAMRHGPRPLLRFEPLPQAYYEGAVPEWRSASAGPSTIRSFLRSAAGHFPRFLLLLLISLPFYWAVQALLNEAATYGLSVLLEEVEDERLALALTVLRAALFVGAFQSVTVFFEYARVHEVLKPGDGLLAVLALPVRILRRRPSTFLGIELAAFVMQLALMLAFIPVDRILGRWPMVAVTAGLAATQLFLFLRILIRSGAQGAQLRLARAHMD